MKVYFLFLAPCRAHDAETLHFSKINGATLFISAKIKMLLHMHSPRSANDDEKDVSDQEEDI